jgi:hypothetical protein
MMSMGKGAMVNVSRKHKMNVASSTESELVSIADVLGMILWCKYFMEAQGYTIESNVLYQDNKSTILLAKNGRMSAGKNSKHIKNRFFLITDKVAQGDVELKHIGTKSMWADVNTKPVQGLQFRIFRHEMMGVPVEYDDDVERRRTHPTLLPAVKTTGPSPQDLQVLTDIGVTSVTKTEQKAPAPEKKGTLRGKMKVSSQSRCKPSPRRRSVLGEPKYGSGSVPQWKTGVSRYPAVYRALLEEHSGNKLARVNQVNQRVPVIDERLRIGKAKRRRSDPLGRPVRNQ